MRIQVTMQWDSSASDRSIQRQIAAMLHYAARLIAEGITGEITGEPTTEPIPLAYDSTGEVFGDLSILS